VAPRYQRGEARGLPFHDCRHTAATKLLEQGTPFAVVAQILGWSASMAVRMGKRFGHIRPEVKRQASEAIATPEIRTGVDECAPKCATSHSCAKIIHDQRIHRRTQARSSARLERYLDTVEVWGSSPHGPTMQSLRALRLTSLRSGLLRSRF